MKLPKVKFSFSTKDGLREFELDVRVSTEFKFYFAVSQLPEELRSLSIAPNGPRVYKSSYFEIEQEIDALITDYELSIVDEHKEKVILYSIGYTDRHSGQKISFTWRTAQKLELRSGKSTKVEYFTERKSSGYGHHSQALDPINTYEIFDDKFEEMPWSREREEWFRSMEAAVEALAQRLKKGFGTRPELLMRRIDQGAQVLLMAPEAETKE